MFASLLPPDLAPLMALALIGLSFITSLITATFSLGGGTLMIAVLALVMGLTGSNDFIDNVRAKIPGLEATGNDGWTTLDDPSGGFVAEMPVSRDISSRERPATSRARRSFESRSHDCIVREPSHAQ